MMLNRQLPRSFDFYDSLDEETTTIHPRRRWPTNEYISCDEAAKILGLQSGSLLVEWRKSGYFPNSYSLPQGEWRFQMSEVQEFLRDMNEAFAYHKHGRPYSDLGPTPLTLPSGDFEQELGKSLDNIRFLLGELEKWVDERRSGKGFRLPRPPQEYAEAIALLLEPLPKDRADVQAVNDYFLQVLTKALEIIVILTLVGGRP